MFEFNQLIHARESLTAFLSLSPLRSPLSFQYDLCSCLWPPAYGRGSLQSAKTPFKGRSTSNTIIGRLLGNAPSSSLTSDAILRPNDFLEMQEHFFVPNISIHCISLQLVSYCVWGLEINSSKSVHRQKCKKIIKSIRYSLIKSLGQKISEGLFAVSHNTRWLFNFSLPASGTSRRVAVN